MLDKKDDDDSGSDYDVNEYIKPEKIIHTYDNKKDLLSEASDEENSEDDSEASENSNGEEIIEDQQPAIEPRTNSRFILYISNLNFETSKEKLHDIFSEHGAVKSIRIPKIRKGGFAFVEMVDEDGYQVI